MSDKSSSDEQYIGKVTSFPYQRLPLILQCVQLAFQLLLDHLRISLPLRQAHHLAK
jgi:hypothetical protein